MIREATIDDVPVCAQAIAQLKDQTGWGVMPWPFDVGAIEDWLAKIIWNPAYCLYVWDDGQIQAGAGGYVFTQLLPPHLRCLSEWAWWGSGKQAVRVFHSVEQWGRGRGAVLSGYCLARPGQGSTVTETWRWRRLDGVRG